MNNTEVKKVGILSCYSWLMKTGNYGTLFQNYALQKALEQLGFKCVWVAAAPEKKAILSKLLFWLLNPHRILIGCSRFLASRFHNNSHDISCSHLDAIYSFMDKYVPCTPSLPLSALKNKGYLDDISAYIVGSDNVWSEVDEMFFLGFVRQDVPKIAYAASAAWGYLSEDWVPRATPFLKRFKSISVREIDGVAYVRKTGREATNVLDPTLLLHASDYIKLINATANESPYVFSYFCSPQTLEDIRFADISQYCDRKGIQLYVSAIQGAENHIDSRYLLSLSPVKWLKKMRDAEWIATNSFHGLAFSIIFKKQFVLFLKKGRSERGNSRFLSLLTALGLEDRICGEFDSIEEIVNKPINWVDCSEKLEQLRFLSLEYLSNSLKGCSKSR